MFFVEPLCIPLTVGTKPADNYEVEFGRHRYSGFDGFHILGVPFYIEVIIYEFYHYVLFSDIHLFCFGMHVFILADLIFIKHYFF